MNCKASSNIKQVVNSKPLNMIYFYARSLPRCTILYPWYFFNFVNCNTICKWRSISFRLMRNMKLWWLIFWQRRLHHHIARTISVNVREIVWLHVTFPSMLEKLYGYMYHYFRECWRNYITTCNIISVYVWDNYMSNTNWLSLSPLLNETSMWLSLYRPIL